MRISPSDVSTWKLCCLSCGTLLLLSIIPQIHVVLVRGRDWHGAYVSSQSDEPLYSAYVNALIDGRPRKNDPFGSRDDSSEAPLPESIFSIQFVPAYMIALPARIFGISASTAFIVLIALTAVLSGLAVFWLLADVVNDRGLAAAGTLFVLCLGGMSGKFGLFGTSVDIPFPALLFLRRYEPAATFPLFFVFLLLVWRVMVGKGVRGARIMSIFAGLTFATLVYSYLYLWTAAAGWFACFSVLWLCLRPSDRTKALKVLTTIGAIAVISLVPFFFLISQRPVVIDEQQILVSTHWPDLWRLHEALGVAILVMLMTGIRRGRIARTDPRVIFVASLALLPLLVFNQQILTGKTIQAFHFENYVVNYSTMVGLVILIHLFWQPVSRRLLIWVAALSFAWGVIAVGLPAQWDSVPSAIARDKSVPLFVRLKEVSKEDGTVADLQAKGRASNFVFSPDVTLTKWLPTWTSQGTLLDQTGVDCGTMTIQERKEAFYQHLYFSRVEAETLLQALNGTLNPFRKELTSAAAVIFGPGKVFPELSPQPVPIQSDEVEREVRAYQTYAASFSRESALARPIAYAVVAAEDNFDFSNVDRWYERDAGERVGDYILYRLKLRD